MCMLALFMDYLFSSILDGTFFVLEKETMLLQGDGLSLCFSFHNVHELHTTFAIVPKRRVILCLFPKVKHTVVDIYIICISFTRRS